MRLKARNSKEISKRSIFTGILLESQGSDLISTFPDAFKGDGVATGAHVPGIEHRLVELSAPLKNNRKIKL